MIKRDVYKRQDWKGLKVMKKGFSIYKICGIGLMSALVFVGSMISIEIPLLGDQTRIHFGNIFCLLSGLLLGGVGGGLSAGIGSFLFDAINPKYLPGAPFTFAFKFMMAFVCATIAYGGNSKGKNQKRNIVACVCGALTYVVLYVSKGFIENLIVGTEIGTASINAMAKLGTSTVNGLIAVVFAVPLAFALRKGLEQARLGLSLIHI